MPFAVAANLGQTRNHAGKLAFEGQRLGLEGTLGCSFQKRGCVSADLHGPQQNSPRPCGVVEGKQKDIRL